MEQRKPRENGPRRNGPRKNGPRRNNGPKVKKNSKNVLLLLTVLLKL